MNPFSPIRTILKAEGRVAHRGPPALATRTVLAREFATTRTAIPATAPIPPIDVRPHLVWAFLLQAFCGLHVAAQVTSPTLEINPGTGRTNLAVRLNSEAGWFYTLRTSENLTNWTSTPGRFAWSETLSWTFSLGPEKTQQFFHAKVNPPNPVVVANYQGWPNAVFLNNGIVEAVIVPAAGRVLQFRFLGSTNGPFWENESLYGRNATPSSWGTPGSFGGDKAWPSPQSDWGWPPPAGFDGSTNAVSHSNGVVTLVTPVDATYQIRATRVIELGFDEPVMRIRTIFERVAATAWTNKSLGVWIITQLRDPVRCFVPVPSPSIFPSGPTQLGSGLPTQFQHTNGFISFTRDPSASHKLGFDAGTLIWIGTNLTLRIDAPRVPGLPEASYPDNGSSTEIYTSSGTPYVEHEFLGPLSRLPVGERLEFVTSYLLFQRMEADPEAEARRVLN